MKKKNNKWLSATLAACMVLGSVPAYSYSWPVLAAEAAVQEAVADGEIDTSVEGLQTLRYYTNTETAVTSAQTKSERLSDFFYGTNSMKWSVDFKTSGSGLQALLALNTGSQYYVLYIKGGKLALGDLDKTNHIQTTSTNYADDAWHTAVLEVKKNGKTTITVDGTNVLEKDTTSSMYVGDWQPAQFTVGGMTSYGSASQTAGWTYNGSMKNIVLTKTVAVTQTPVFEISNPGTEAITTNAAALTTGAINASYRLKKGSTGKVDLLTLADGAKLYLDPAAKKVGIQKKDNSTVAYDVANTALGTEKWHTLTLKVNGTDAEVLVDGVSAGSKAFSDTLDVSKLTFGSDIYCSAASVYNKELGEAQITDLHSGTASAVYKDSTPKMTGYYKTENRELFNSGYDGSAAYRIPAIVTSKKTGTVFTSIDKRWNGGADVGVIDSVIRRSKDNGETWGALQPVIDLSDSYGYTVDPALAVDNDENSEHYGRVYMLVDMFPSNIGFASATQGNGYKEVNGQKYQVLTDSSNAEYTVRENGVVYDSQGAKTAYQVEVEDKQPFTARGELYKDGKRVGNIYKNSELKVQQTCYLWMTYSDDDGETWANPTDITPMVKADWMKFCGTGPGAGVQLKNGTIMFPVYCTNGNGKQSSFNVYTTDGGKTWNRGGSPNNGGDMQNATSELTESCIITLDNGHLMQFMRSYNGVVTTAVSTDNGLTWSETTKHSGIIDPYCQMSAVHYGTLTDPADNKQKEAIIFSNPAGGGRKGGKVRIAFVNADDTLTWAYSKLIEENKYVYSSLTVMQDGNIGLIYEQEAYAAIGAAFTSFSPQYIMDTNVYENTPTPTKIAATLTDASGKTVTELKEGTTITADVTFSQNVFAAGNVTLNVRVGDKVREAQLEGNTTENTLRFVYEVTAEDTGKVVVTGEVNTKDNGVAETVYNVSLSSKPITTKDVTVGSIASASETTFAELPVTGMTATAGSQYAESGNEGPASNVLDNNLNTHWHSKYNEDNASNGGRPKHWITINLGGTYLIDSLKYTPRTGGLNGTITEYQIEVSTDGTNFTPVATGNWEKNADVKTAYFGGAVKATHVKLRAIDTKDEWATAAEIRVTGTNDLTAAVDKTNVFAVLAEYDAYAENTEFTALADAVKEAKAAAGKPNATADEIKTAADKVNAAVEAAGTLAKTNLTGKIQEGAEKVQENYTLSSWVAYAEALETAKAVNDSSTKAEILKAYTSLAKAEANLVQRSNIVTVESKKAELKAVIEEMADLTEADYTEASWKVYKEAVAAAQGVYDKSDAALEEVIDALNAVNAAKSALKKQEVVKEDQVVTAPTVSYTAPEADAYAKAATVGTTAEAVHHETVADQAEKPATLEKADSSVETTVAYDTGVWGFTGRLIAPVAGTNNDKFDISGTTPMAMRLKVKLPSNSNNVQLIGKMDYQYGVQVNGSTKKVILYCCDTNSGWPEVSYSFDDTFWDTWHDILVVYTGTGMQLYVDGNAATPTSGRPNAAAGYTVTWKSYNTSVFGIGYNAQKTIDKTENGVTLKTLDQIGGKVADIQLYSGTDYTNGLTKDYEAVSNILDTVTPNVNITVTPYDVKTTWAAGDEVLAGGAKFASGTSYTATTVFTAHEGFTFAENSKPSVAGATVTVSDDGKTMTVTKTFEKTAEVTCSCALSEITGVEDQTVALDVADSKSVKLEPKATATPCRVDGHNGTVVYTYAVKTAGKTGATVTTDGMVTVKDAGEAVITITATLSRKGEESLVKTKDVKLTVTSNKASAAEKNELKNEVASVAGQIADKDNYTAESYQKLKDAVDAANRLINSGTASKEQIAEAKAAIAAAKSGLITKTAAAKKKLGDLLDEVAKLDKNLYTVESYNAMVVADEEAIAAYNKADATEEELTKVYNALTKAQDKLVFKLDQAKNEAAKALEAAKVIYEAGQKDYDDASWTAFGNAYNALKNADEKADAATLTTLIKALTKAQGALTVKKDETPKPVEEVKLDAPAVKVVKAKAAKGGVTVTVTVEPVKDAASYDVYRVVKGKASKVGTTAAGKTAVTDKKAVRGASYYAVAVSADGKTVSKSGAAVAVKLAKAPKIKKATAGSRNAKLTWKKAKGTKVVVYRSTKKNSGYKKVATSRKGAASLVNKKLKAGKTYYYKIATVKGKTVSAMSKAKRVKIKK